MFSLKQLQYLLFLKRQQEQSVFINIFNKKIPDSMKKTPLRVTEHNTIHDTRTQSINITDILALKRTPRALRPSHEKMSATGFMKESEDNSTCVCVSFLFPGLGVFKIRPKIPHTSFKSALFRPVPCTVPYHMAMYICI